MKEKVAKILNILISIGFALLVFCAFVVMPSLKELQAPVFYVLLLIFQILLGILCQIFAVYKSKRAYQIFLGAVLSTWGIITLSTFVFSELTFNIVWPLYSLDASILLFLCGIYRYKKLKAGYGLTALILFIMSLWNLLFSLKIIKLSFKIVSSVVVPLSLVLITIIFVFIFFLQKKHKELVITDENPGDFEDDEFMQNIED